MCQPAFQNKPRHLKGGSTAPSALPCGDLPELSATKKLLFVLPAEKSSKKEEVASPEGFLESNTDEKQLQANSSVCVHVHRYVCVYACVHADTHTSNTAGARCGGAGPCPALGPEPRPWPGAGAVGGAGRRVRRRGSVPAGRGGAGSSRSAERRGAETPSDRRVGSEPVGLVRSVRGMAGPGWCTAPPRTALPASAPLWHCLFPLSPSCPWVADFRTCSRLRPSSVFPRALLLPQSPSCPCPALPPAPGAATGPQAASGWPVRSGAAPGCLEQGRRDTGECSGDEGTRAGGTTGCARCSCAVGGKVKSQEVTVVVPP